MTKKINYGVQINQHNWKAYHAFGTKSAHFDHNGYFESSSLSLFGELWMPKLNKIKETKIEFYEDKIGCLKKEYDSFNSVGDIYFETETRLLRFIFFLSSDFFGRVSSSLQANKIDMFLAQGEPLKNDFAEAFHFVLRTG